jgi:hypothetical protein
MTLPADMDYLYSDVPQDELLREYGRVRAAQRRAEREGHRPRFTSRAHALVIARHALRTRVVA